MLTAAIQSLLQSPTPKRWLDHALESKSTLLIDQANCEKKAAATAVSLLHRFGDRGSLSVRLSQIAREELKHFEIVLKFMSTTGISNAYLSAGRYASNLREWMSKREPYRSIDLLLVCAMIEARSCERIGALLEVIDEEYRKLYLKLHEAEERHCEFYLALVFQEDRNYGLARLTELAELEHQLITTPDSEFRFHSGIPD